MAQKYHIDKNGMPAICKATKRPCPLGGDEAHFDTYEEAYEASQDNLQSEYSLLSNDVFTSEDAEALKPMMFNAEAFVRSLNEGSTKEIEALSKVKPNVDFIKVRDTIEFLDTAENEIHSYLSLYDEDDDVYQALEPMTYNAKEFIRSVDLNENESVIKAFSEIMPDVDLIEIQEHIEIMDNIEDEIYSEVQLV